MRSEPELRRADFLGGIPVQLADGGLWALPGPRELSPMGAPRDPSLVALLMAIATAETEPERCRLEFALAIHLLRRNYALAPHEYARLLSSPDHPERQAALRSAFRGLALRHAAALAPRDVSDQPAATRNRRFRFPLFRPHRSRARAAERATPTRKAAS